MLLLINVPLTDLFGFAETPELAQREQRAAPQPRCSAALSWLHPRVLSCAGDSCLDVSELCAPEIFPGFSSGKGSFGSCQLFQRDSDTWGCSELDQCLEWLAEKWGKIQIFCFPPP